MSSFGVEGSALILLVGSQKSVQDDVQRVVTDLQGDPRLSAITARDLGLVRALGLVPDVIIIDDGLTDDDPVDLIRRLNVRLPASVILVLVERDALEMARLAMLQGARAFITKPIEPDELQTVLTWALEQRAQVATAPVATPVEPPAPRQPSPAWPLARALAITIGILGILVAAGLLLPSVIARQPGWGKQAAETAVEAVTSVPSQALVAKAMTITPEQGQPPVAGKAEPTRTSTGEAVEVAQAADGSPTATETPTASETPTGRPTPAATATPTASPTEEPSATPVPSATATPLPTDTPVPTPTLVPSATPRATSTRRAPSPTARIATPVPSKPSLAPMALNAPTLVEPRPGETRTGTVKFAWQPRGTLPDGTAYEVVWWNPGEDPATARGIAATTTQTSLTADLDGLYATGQFPGRDHYWTVIVVQTAPYVRLMQPAQGAAQLLTYDAPSGGSQSPPPKPRD